MDKVSIIVPVYNVEAYLARCIDSLIGQTYENIEILLVDDKSKDESARIIREYAKRDNRVKALFQENNQGVSAARNRGLDEMTGEWVCFCDSDDWYEKNFVEKMLMRAKDGCADYIVCDYQIVSENRTPVVSGSINAFLNEYDKKSVIACGPTSSCTHMIHKELFSRGNVRYPVNCKQYEELPVIPVLARYANKIAFVHEALYNYYQRGNGTSASNIAKDSEKNFLQALSFMTENIGSGYGVELEYHAIYALFYGEVMNLCKKKEKTSVILNKIKQYEKMYPEYYKNKYISKMGIAKRCFLWLVYNRLIVGVRILSWIHGKMVS